MCAHIYKVCLKSTSHKKAEYSSETEIMTITASASFGKIKTELGYLVGEVTEMTVRNFGTE
jgi:hypothetical protein